MKLSELKNKLLSGDKISLPLIFIASNNDYLINQYISQIAKNNLLEQKEISSIGEMVDIESGVFKDKEYLYIYQYNGKDQLDFDLLGAYNIIILTEKEIAECPIESVVFGKLENWQIEDYVSVLIPGLGNREIKWLCDITQYDLNRLENEASKINIFDKKDQNKIFGLINDDNGYCDLNELGIFNLSNAIIKKDIVGIKKVLDNIDYIDVEGTGLATILIKNFLNVINVQLNSKATPENCKMSEKQFKYYQYYLCNKYSNEKLINNYKFLTNIDYRLKSGLLEMTNQQLVYYIVQNIL